MLAMESQLVPEKLLPRKDISPSMRLPIVLGTFCSSGIGSTVLGDGSGSGIGSGIGALATGTRA